MPYNFIDGYGSVLTADSSVVGSAIRPIVHIGSVLSVLPVFFSGSPSISGQVGASIIGAVNVNPSSVYVLNPVSVLAVNPNPASVQVLNPVSVLAVTQGTPEWIVKSSIAGGIFPISGSVAAEIINTNLNISGSVASFHMGNASVIAIIQGSVATVGTAAANQSVSGQVGASIIGTVPVIQSGTVISSVSGAIAPTGTVTSVATQASTLNLLASNSGRRGATIMNTAGTSVLVKLGLMAGVTDHTVVMQDTDYYEVPFNYSGVIQHFSSSVAGFIRITEIT